MCLSYNDALTQELRNKFQENPGKPLTFYKYYIKEKSFLSCFHQYSMYTSSGIIKSNRIKVELSSQEKDYYEVYTGIHVFLNRKDARRQLEGVIFLDYGDMALVKITAYEKDLVGAGYFNGNESAVFMKVEISKVSWRNLFKKKN